MQCPNCGKEAINVNGRYVCLECGIELSQSGAPVNPPPVSPAVDNHAPANLSDAMVPPTPTPPSTPKEPAFPNTSDAPTANPTEPSVPGQEPTPATDTPIAEPVKDYFVNALNSEEPGQPDNSTGQDASGQVLPDFPASVSGTPAPQQIESQPAEPKEASSEATPTPNLSMDSEFASTDGHDSLTEQPTTEEPAPVPEPQPLTETPTVPEPTQTVTPSSTDNFFQPSEVNIQPNAQPEENPTPFPEPTSEPIPYSEEQAPPVPEPQTVPTTEPIPEPEPQPQPFTSTPEPEEVPTPEPTPAPAFASTSSDLGQNAPLVDPLDQVSPVDGMGAPKAESTDTSGDTQSSTNFPGTSNIPSTESVFGSPPTTTPPIQTGGKKFNKKLILIIGGIVLILLLLGVGAMFLISSSGSKNTNQTTQNSSGQTLNISQYVAGQMDETTDVGASFTQTLDFSKATTKDTALALFFSKPVDLKEDWAVSKKEDLSLNATQGTTVTKRIFIEAENTTYVYSDATKSYVKVEGMQLSPTSVFFPLDPRGSLYYLSKVDSFEDLGTDKVDGAEAKKIKVNPKKTTIEELLMSATPLFAKIKYQDLNTDNLQIFAWYNDKNQILKVSVSGEVEVTSDLFTGPVKITAEGTYKYQAQTVTKP